MSLTQTEIVGFVRVLLELLVGELDALLAAGVDAAKFRDILMKELAATMAANDRQEALKRELKDATAIVEDLYAKLYRTGSTYLDSVIGAVGKTTTAGKNFQRLRSRVRMPGDQSSEVTTPGGPAPGTVA
jgi:hypothetical protein